VRTGQREVRPEMVGLVGCVARLACVD